MQGRSIACVNSLAFLPPDGHGASTFRCEDASKCAPSLHRITEEIRTLLARLEKKDLYSLKHSIRVGRYAAVLAYELDLPPEMILQTYFCGLLHDIGKIAIPQDILTKDGPLSESEFRIMQSHPVFSAQICRFYPSLRAFAPIIRAHHERQDGRGYPDHIGGDAIPIPAQLLAVADALDAMTSNRPYRKHMPLKKAGNILKAGAGSQWNAKVVAAALEVLPKGQFESALSPEWSLVYSGPSDYELKDETSFCSV